MKRVLCMFFLAGITACVKHEDPSWAKQPAGGVSGESTITGTPMRVAKLAKKPTWDGKLDDPEWAGATSTSAFVQPGDGSESPGHDVSAFAKLGYDDQNFYVGGVIFDRSPTSPFQASETDPHVWEKSSAIELMIQPGDFGDNREYYEIQVDVHGAVFDSHWDDYNTPITGVAANKIFGHQEWSGKEEHAIFIQPDRFYSFEIAIPWSAFVPVAGRATFPPKSGDVWRLNLYSFKDGQRAALAWSPIRGQGNFHKSARFGRIKFE